MIFTMKPELYTENKELPLQPDAKVVSTNDFDYIASELMAAGKKEPDLEHIDGDMNVSEFRQDANDTGFYPEENVEPDDIGDIVD